MTTSNKVKIIDIAETISNNLAFRQSVNDLFKHIKKMEESTIKIDFSDATFMSNSFAHQYLLNKRKSKKHISELNTPQNIRQMFDLVEKRKTKPKKISNIKPTVLEVAV